MFFNTHSPENRTTSLHAPTFRPHVPLKAKPTHCNFCIHQPRAAFEEELGTSGSAQVASLRRESGRPRLPYGPLQLGLARGEDPRPPGASRWGEGGPGTQDTLLGGHELTHGHFRSLPSPRPSAPGPRDPDLPAPGVARVPGSAGPVSRHRAGHTASALARTPQLAPCVHAARGSQHPQDLRRAEREGRAAKPRAPRPATSTTLSPREAPFLS